ncbi:hypothetical protein BN1708_007873 [Verticillium longisporum]|uniref:Uncharacterized protein n=1 Tax=Verticillium longisporum TaxID=100787 RepID=A0A0G4MWH3_VERLO|nr:hypothetical protein BN1708_007873 [Verticillium longisporum]
MRSRPSAGPLSLESHPAHPAKLFLHLTQEVEPSQRQSESSGIALALSADKMELTSQRRKACAANGTLSESCKGKTPVGWENCVVQSRAFIQLFTVAPFTECGFWCVLLPLSVWLRNGHARD